LSLSLWRSSIRPFLCQPTPGRPPVVDVCLYTGTRDGGVDVVLNTLTSPGLVAASLALLTVGGRFVEISKRDVVAASRLMQDRPDVAAAMLAIDFLPPQQLQVSLMSVRPVPPSR